jgi:hypothetical protein
MRAIKRKLQEIRSERAEKRHEIFEKGLEMYRSGVDARKIYKELMKKGIPQRTRGDGPLKHTQSSHPHP